MHIQELRSTVDRALERVRVRIDADLPVAASVQLERPKDATHGDWSTNAAMVNSKLWRKAPRDIAALLVEELGAPDSEGPESTIESIEMAGPGFVNLRLSAAVARGVIAQVISEGEDFGCVSVGAGERVQVEFVSANPVGPMHLGHGRWAAVGDSLCRLLDFAGYKVEREFYVNDYGNQMNIFGASVSARYRELMGEPLELPEDGYRGSYVIDIAQEIVDADGDAHLNLTRSEQSDLFKERAYRQVLEHLEKTLSGFGVDFDVWYSESSLHEDGKVREVVDRLVADGHAFEADGAIWMRTTAMGDEKDRVLVRSDGSPTYFAADVAYHADKLERGFDRLINIWGADHHGYVARVKAAVAALGYDPDRLEVIIGQLVNLLRAGEPVRMSKRTGEMVTFEELISEVGIDATRFFFLMRSTDSTVDFDIDVAKQRSADNPVYYVQYAHARICSIIRTAAERGEHMPQLEDVDLSVLVHPAEIALMKEIDRIREVVAYSAQERAPHKMTIYVRELAESFHSFYTGCRVVGAGEKLTPARLVLCAATRQTLRNGLGILGISAPESM